MPQKILIPPGKTQTITCPDGNAPLVKQGDLLPNHETPNIYVVDVKGQNIILGPTKAGLYDLPALCQELEQTWTVEVVAPNPQQVSKKMFPISPYAIAYPGWLWIALAIALLSIALLALLIAQIKKNKDKLKNLGQRVRIRKTPTQKMDSFLTQATRDKVETAQDNKTAEFLYGDGTKHLRAVIQQAVKFKAPGATRREFVVVLKQNLGNTPNLITTQQMSQLESLFMQSSQVDYSGDSPSPQHRAAFLRQLKEFSELFIKEIQSQELKSASVGKKSKFRKADKKK